MPVILAGAGEQMAMNAQTDGMRIIQSRLADAVERLHAEAPRLSDAAVRVRMGAIERQALEHGMTPLARVARAGMCAAARPGHRTALARHLERMEDAAGCRPLDEAGTAAIMASIAVRLA